MGCEEYLSRSQLFRRLRSGPHGRLVECYAARLVRDNLVRHGTWRCLNVVGGLLCWIAMHRCMLADLDERMVEQYLRHRATEQSIQPGDRIRAEAMAVGHCARRARSRQRCRRLSPHTIGSSTSSMPICGHSAAWPRSRSFVISPVIRRFLHEVCPAGDDDLGKISQEEVIRYIERHAQDWSPGTGKAMCWSLRAFLRYLHHQG